MERLDADFVILGSGFAGSLAAMILKRLDFRPVVVDRATHPRFAIGESSTPVANFVLRDLVEKYDLTRLAPLAKYGPWQKYYPQIGCGLKRGFSYFEQQPGRRFEPRPDHANELLVAASADDEHSDTQWLRADVDSFLASEVRRMEIPLLEQTEIVQLVRDGDGWLVSGRRGDGHRLVVPRDFAPQGRFCTGWRGGAAVALGRADRRFACRRVRRQCDSDAPRDGRAGAARTDTGRGTVSRGRSGRSCRGRGTDRRRTRIG